ncbi:MAG TPA: hypothetical protein VFJ24_03195 [Gaiellales bacterium]|nr:hypothetical protein [Gaiellales bacterium]
MSSVADKLRIRPGAAVRLIHAPDRHRPLMGHVIDVSPADVVLVYSRSQAQLERDAATAIGAVRDGGILWVCYPKRSAGTPSDMSRDVCRELMLRRGWDAVSQISIDDVWSAMRFKPAG